MENKEQVKGFFFVLFFMTITLCSVSWITNNHAYIGSIGVSLSWCSTIEIIKIANENRARNERDI